MEKLIVLWEKPKQVLKKLTILFAFLIIAGCGSSKKTEQDPFGELSKLMDQYAENALAKGNINTIALAVYRDGEIYHNYFGETPPGADNLPNDSTLIEIASISKTFVGSLVARAVVEDKIHLDDDIRKYLGNGYPNLEFEGQAITVRHLLTHTIGFEGPAELDRAYKKLSEGFYEDNEMDYSKADFLEELKNVELDKAPGSHYDYNNTGPEILAYILEQVNGEPFEKQLSLFFEELEMEDSYSQQHARHRGRIMRGYDENGERAPIFSGLLFGGAGGIITTLPDLVKYMKFQLESTDPLIREATRFLNEDKDVGYFWDMGVAEKEGFYYLKTGTSGGTQSCILICPDSNYGQIVIVNNTDEASYGDWLTLYNEVETDLILYPKINLKNKLKPMFLKDPEGALQEFKTLSKQKDKYFNTDLTFVLNAIGYDLLNGEGSTDRSIAIFKLAISEDPENANLFDSLGEAFFVAKDYKNAIENFKKSLELNPENENAIAYIDKINDL